ncbi:MAG: hypothetical protein H6712_06030 [Myxococcales bacterium]|nr:hypothetical protein [Myxococcales bacterium]MCB9713395.1 hypothetical protein [Myxococcales bacterium]
MSYRCARCHHEFSAPSEGEGELACPSCGAEAGLEPIHGIPLAMKLFGMLVAGVVVLAVGGGLLSRLAG